MSINLINFHSYSEKYVKEYIEGAKPLLSVGEYWDSCNYNGQGLDYNQGIMLHLEHDISVSIGFKNIIIVFFSIMPSKFSDLVDDSYIYLCCFVLTMPTDSHRQRVINWIDGTGQLSTAFDFTTKGVLQVFLKCL